MNEREVADVEEVLDYARTARSHAVRPRDQHVIRRIVEQLEFRDPAGATAEAHPYDAIGFRRQKGIHPRLFRWNLLGVRSISTHRPSVP